MLGSGIHPPSARYSLGMSGFNHDAYLTYTLNCTLRFGSVALDNARHVAMVDLCSPDLHLELSRDSTFLPCVLPGAIINHEVNVIIPVRARCPRTANEDPGIITLRRI